MLVDFHTHSAASDGALSPRELLARAAAAGVELLAITDHDTVAGFQCAAGHYKQIGASIRLVSGVEFSCRWSGTTVHILGLGMDCDHPAMRQGLSVIDLARRDRGKKIAGRMEALGFAGALEGALAEAGDSQLGRPHFAAWMVGQGHAADYNEAFDKYLGQGKTGDVKAFWPELSQVTRWIVDGGGVAIIAHPLKYRFTRMKLRRLVIDFLASGGTGIEIISGRQSADQISQLKRLATEFDMEVSLGSDFHRDGPYTAPLGIALPALDGLRGVWERWVDTAQPPGNHGT